MIFFFLYMLNIHLWQFFPSSQDAFHRPSLGAYCKGPTTFSTGLLKQYHKVPADASHQTKPFSLILPKRTDTACERPDNERISKENNVDSSYEILESGMILLKNYLSISDQVPVFHAVFLFILIASHIIFVLAHLIFGILSS